MKFWPFEEFGDRQHSLGFYPPYDTTIVEEFLESIGITDWPNFYGVVYDISEEDYLIFKLKCL